MAMKLLQHHTVFHSFSLALTHALLFLIVVSLYAETNAVTAASFLNHNYQQRLQPFYDHSTTQRKITRPFINHPTYKTSMSMSSSFWSSWKWWERSQSPNPQKQAPTTTKNNRTKYEQVKKVTFVRHGCTYMNEYLSGRNGKRYGSYDFTDIFTSSVEQKKYHDTPLSPTGIEQASTLGSYLNQPPKFIQNGCDIVIVSPLTRALQTFTLGIKPYLDQSESLSKVPIVATPLAAERLYLISDVGRPKSQLQKEYPNIDFDSSFNMFENENNDVWWYQPDDSTVYEEWRPTGQQQRYACYGEPYDMFNLRMSRLYYYIQNRTENNIIIVCHHGVIDWFLDISFANCQYKQVPFTSIQPRTLIRSIDQVHPKSTTITASTNTVARL